MNTKDEVAIGLIEKELGALWEEAPDPSHMKACLFNLIVYTKNAERAEYFYELIRSILEKFPCRIIFIVGSDEKTQDSMKVSVSNDMIGNENKHVPCDQILLQVSGEEQAKIPFIVLPLIVPDLPVYLVWGEEPTANDPLLKQLSEMATRVVFDSEYTGNIQNYSKKILTLMENENTEVMDMKWAHISRWRDILATVFDSPEKIADLLSLQQVQIDYAGQPHGVLHHDQTQALLLQAWLASRLQWKLVSIEHSSDTSSVHYETSNGKLTVTLNPVTNTDIPPAALETLSFLTTNGTTYEISRLKKYPKVIVGISTTEACALPYTLPLPTMRRGLTFLKELFYAPASGQYRDTLEFLASKDWGSCND